MELKILPSFYMTYLILLNECNKKCVVFILFFFLPKKYIKGDLFYVLNVNFENFHTFIWVSTVPKTALKKLQMFLANKFMVFGVTINGHCAVT